MKKFAQIVDNKIHWICEVEKELPEYPPEVEFIEITKRSPMPEERWEYNRETNRFTKPKENIEEFPIPPSVEKSDGIELKKLAYPAVTEQLDCIFKTLKYLRDSAIDIGPDGNKLINDIQSIKDKFKK